MKASILAILSIAVMASLAANAAAFDDSTGKTADELFNNSEESFVPSDSSFRQPPKSPES
jgi:hypothetical protein